MNAKNEKEMGSVARIINIFTSPKAAFESINRKPTWLVPFLVIVVVSVVLAVLSMDIGLKDMLENMRAQDTPQEQMDVLEARMAGPLKYVNLAAVPVVTIVIWAFFALVFLLTGNMAMGGSAKYKTIFSVIAWSSFVSLLGSILKTLLILQKGTTRGVNTSLSVLLPIPGVGENSGILYRLLSRLDIFTIWTLVLWIIGFGVIFKFTNKKSATMVLSLWAVYIIVSVALGGILKGFGR